MAHMHCPECGQSFKPQRMTQQFCTAAHRKSFNNRRAVRGAELYDLFMALRFERGWAKATGLFQLMCRLASVWKQEDTASGRASYIRPDRWVAENRASMRGIAMRQVR